MYVRHSPIWNAAWFRPARVSPCSVAIFLEGLSSSTSLWRFPGRILKAFLGERSLCVNIKQDWVRGQEFLKSLLVAIHLKQFDEFVQNPLQARQASKEPSTIPGVLHKKFLSGRRPEGDCAAWLAPQTESECKVASYIDS